MEMQKVPEAGYKIEGLWISGLQRHLTLDNLAFPLKVISSVARATKLVKNFKPHAVVGVGGYASGPLVFAATRQGVPALLQEQNGYAGLTNKLLARYVQKICVAYPGLEAYFPAQKLVFTGNPVRRDILEARHLKAQGLKHFGLRPERKTLLIIGGSLGARTLNKSIQKGLDQLLEQGVQVIWQTGKFYYDTLYEATKHQQGELLRIMPFIKEMPLAYGAADVVISRAGALSISELCLAAKPSILVPSPNVAEDHQTKNARNLVQEGAALLVRDAQAPEELVPEALRLLQDAAQQQELSRNISRLARPQAAEHIANEILGLIK
ncbi:UDP-N-acetylglucosamine--N-acetylmuramyl-(pentapeptide) pyrophosphoryl-undecaprenol N-acetylglucosamine transferase [Cesiribacter andamanensis AMV16]|uniref:UDP-N-acetylglucosamine--N-acetylmuramyl-(pentapeptide) pyrophosphoryl-undecaprenol N-acetylglucosamine transferase n=2 Tax=Cesiribacter TaxID=1133570 RepID=M7NP93_9BACT|nr:UDP-N-acetylglucosamine--N-acetylmuramyl-(pentapeptide) pyrophosphoryl-undecaprenol N-acetylglucosamine transferase [Cesiribacter andamanensis AMV16]